MKTIVIMATLTLLNVENLENSALTPGEEILEIAYYRVKPEFREGFESMSRKYIDEILAQEKGYLRSNTYQSLEDKSLYVDLVWWRSLGEAQEAEKVFTSDKRFDAFNQSIEEVIYYDHAQMLEGGKLTYKEVEANDVLELAKSKIKNGKVDAYNKSRQPLMSEIALKYDEFHEEQSYVSINNKDIVIGLVYWSDPAICPIAQHAVPQEQAHVYQPFAETFDESYPDVIFSLFKKIR